MAKKPYSVRWDRTDEIEELLTDQLSGDEFESLKLQLLTYEKIGRPPGESIIYINRQPHKIRVDLYMSTKLKQASPLMYCFERKGEPTKKYLTQFKYYVMLIKLEEEKS